MKRKSTRLILAGLVAIACTLIPTENVEARLGEAEDPYYTYTYINDGVVEGYEVGLRPKFREALDLASGGSFDADGDGTADWETGDPLPDPLNTCDGDDGFYDVVSYNGLFYSCTKVKKLDLSEYDTTNVVYMDNMFNLCHSLTDVNLAGENFDTSKVTSMRFMFANCKSITDLDVTPLDTRNVTDMFYMFYSCLNLKDLDVSSFDTSNVTDMSAMFAFCNELEGLDITNFATSKVTSMYEMFAYCESLESIDLGKLDTSKVKNMKYMFSYCTSLTELDLSKFNTENVTNMYGMFAGCTKLEDVDLSSFNTNKVANMYIMFYKNAALINLDLSSFDTDKVADASSVLGSVNTVKVSNTSDMFAYCVNLENAYAMTEEDAEVFNDSLNKAANVIFITK